MNIVFTYLKAHLAKDTTAAVDLADYNPSVNNLVFARKILDVKLTAAEYNFYRKYKKRELNKIKVIKYKKLIKEIDTISQRKTYSYKDLRNENFEVLNKFNYLRIKINNNFSNSNISNVDLRGIFLDGSKFINSDLSGTKIHINDADFSNAKLDGAEIKFKNIKYMDKVFVNEKLIDDPDKKKIFNTLRSIDDKYSDIKIDLVKQLISAVHCWRNNYVNLQHIDSFLDYIFSKEYYLEDKETRNSVKSLLDRLTLTRNSEKNIKQNYVSLYLDLISRFFNVQEENDFMLGDNGNFIKLMAISLYHDDINIREKSRDLYDKYLKLEKVKPFSEGIKVGNDERVDWDSEGAGNNIILINKDKTMVTSYKELNKMLFADPTKADIQWNLFSLYIKEDEQAINRTNLYNLFNKDFKIFKDNYNVFEDSCHILILNDKFNKLASNFGGYAEEFYSAFIDNPIKVEDRFADDKEYKKLYKVFEELIDIQKGNAAMVSLKEQHYQQICEIFGFKNSNDQVKSKYLLSLAIIFVKYASNDVFGLGNKSPQILKLYAYALMSKANELNSKLMGYDYYDFMSDLVGEGKETTETTGLFFRMRAYGEIHCGSILNKIIPPQWR